jgi:hypothetical protein
MSVVGFALLLTPPALDAVPGCDGATTALRVLGLPHEQPSRLPEMSCDFGVTPQRTRRSIVPLDEGGSDIPMRHDAYVVRIAVIGPDIAREGFRASKKDPPHNSHGFSALP